MSYMDDQQRNKAKVRAAEKVVRNANEQLASDVRALFKQEAMRRVVLQFAEAMGADTSPFNTNAMMQSRGIGMQDAARWWMDLVREYCPEQEVVMRNEARAAAKAAALEIERAAAE